MEFTQLSNVTDLYDGRGAYNEPLKIGRRLSINLDSSLKRKKFGF